MTAETYLLQYERAVRRVERVRAEYDELQDSADCVPSALGNAGEVSGGNIHLEAEELAIALADKASELREAENDAVRTMIRVYRTIRMVAADSEQVGSVLHERYISLRKWDDIARVLGCSVSSLHRLHRRGLAEVAKKLQI